MRELTIGKNDAGQRLDRFVAKSLPLLPLDNACHSVSAIRFSAELRQNDRRYNLEATNNIYLPGGRRVRGFVGIEPLVHPCP